jgi:hypothetical protein
MNKVQEAFKAAIDCIEKNEEWDGQFQYDIQLCKSALSDIEKCEPVGEVYNKDKKYILLNNSDAEHPHGTLLYTSPISKDWVGLSENDIDDVYNDWTTSDHMDYAKDICEKLKQLNAPEKG